MMYVSRLEKLKDPGIKFSYFFSQSQSRWGKRILQWGKHILGWIVSMYHELIDVFFAVPSGIRRMFMYFLHQSCVWQLFFVMKHQ